MNKVGSLESQLMDAFKENEEKEVATTAADAQKLHDKEVHAHAAKIARRQREKFNKGWRRKEKKRRKMAKASRKNNR